MSGTAQDHYGDSVIVRLQEKVADQASAIKRLMAERDGTREENARLRAWAEDEQRKRHKAEEDRVSSRSADAQTAAYRRAVFDALAVVENSISPEIMVACVEDWLQFKREKLSAATRT